MSVFDFIPGYRRHIVGAGNEALFLFLLAFLATFALTRLYTRLARRHGLPSGSLRGVHIHHAVPGVILVVAAGILSFTAFGGRSPTREALALVFGVGAAWVLDEFALVLHLRDVYWSHEGRHSVDAALMAVMATGLLLVVANPFGSDRDLQVPFASAFSVLAFDLGFALLTFLKGKPILGTVAIFVPLVGVIGAVRLAKPGSPWAHVFYEPERGRSPRARARRERLTARAAERHEHGRLARLDRRLSDLIGGRPHL